MFHNAMTDHYVEALRGASKVCDVVMLAGGELPVDPDVTMHSGISLEPCLQFRFWGDIQNILINEVVGMSGKNMRREAPRFPLSQSVVMMGAP